MAAARLATVLSGICKGGALSAPPYAIVLVTRASAADGRADPHAQGHSGEHGGDPTSVEFCNKIGLDYVSCSPFRVPIARLSAAQAAIKQKA